MCAEPRSTNINLLKAVSQISARSHSQAIPVISRECHMPAAPHTSPAPSVPAPTCARQALAPCQRHGPASALAPGAAPTGRTTLSPPSTSFHPISGGICSKTAETLMDGLRKRPHVCACVYMCTCVCMCVCVSMTISACKV